MSEAAALAWREATVERVLPRTDRVTSLFFSKVLPRHRPGQHVDVRLVAEDGYEARRSYSIASPPDSDLLELMVERLEDGEVSPFLHDVVRVGDPLELLGPIGGHFVWTRDDGGPLLLLAGGSGIAPLMAMLRYRDTTARDVPALLVYGVRRWADLVYVDELMEMASRDPLFDFVVATSREAARRPGDIGGRVDRSSLKMLLQRGVERPRVYVCGSTPFVETTTRALVDEGVAPMQIRAERYGDAKSADTDLRRSST
jgi:ferredoxin-NADP reductase